MALAEGIFLRMPQGHEFVIIGNVWEVKAGDPAHGFLGQFQGSLQGAGQGVQFFDFEAPDKNRLPGR